MRTGRRRLLALSGAWFLPLVGCLGSGSNPAEIGGHDPERAVGPESPEELFVSLRSTEDAATLFESGADSASTRARTMRGEIASFVEETAFGDEHLLYAEVELPNTGWSFLLTGVRNDDGDAVVDLEAVPNDGSALPSVVTAWKLVRVGGGPPVDSVTVEFTRGSPGTGAEPTTETYDPRPVSELSPESE